MQKLSFLNDQVSIPANELTHPAPDDKQLETILQSAMSAPDHGGLTPFRFLVIRGDSLLNLSEVFEKAAIKRKADPATISKQKKKPLRSPMIIIVIARLTENPSIPEIEQMLSAGIAAQHIQLACKSLGFGSIWLTGENCYDLTVYESLGLDVNEKLIGFIYIGTPVERPVKKKRPDAKKITQHWTVSQTSDFAI